MDQTKLFEFMAQPEAYDPAPAAVDFIETHASFVFLAGAFAYKMKRAVKYPFLDFSTLEKRRQACLNELRLNRRNAPQIYLKVVPITFEPGRGLQLCGEDVPVEWVLVMRRFDQENLYDRMAAEGRLSLAAMGQLASHIAHLHGTAARTLTTNQAVLPLKRIIREHETVLTTPSSAFHQDAAEVLANATREAFQRLIPLLKRRANGGYLRHCHGDLHLGNIVEIDCKPDLFDALEFDDSLAIIDVLYDLAFLLMDLGKRGLSAHANAVLNGYLDEDGTGNLLGLAALPLFLSLRAMIRAKVALLRAEKGLPADAVAAREAAGAYFGLAVHYLESEPPRLIAMGGLSGSGKSTIARTIAAQIGGFPGAVIVRSDVERKRLFGMLPHQRLSRQAYTQEVSDLVYKLCRKRAAFVLDAGKSVIVDAVHARPEERDAIAELAEEYGASFTGLWFDVSAELMQERVARRIGDVSDATSAVVQTQLAYDLGPIGFDRVDASGPIADVARRCLERIRNSSA